MTAVFSHMLTTAEIGQGRELSLEANEQERAAIAARLDLVELKSLRVDAKISSIAGGIKVQGVVKASVVQACAATDLPVPAKLTEEFDLRFLRNFDENITPSEDDEIEIEISSDDCEVMPLEQERVDAAEAAVQTLSLALDPFPRHPDADKVLAEKGVLSEDQAGPFAALAALKGKMEK